MLSDASLYCILSVSAAVLFYQCLVLGVLGICSKVVMRCHADHYQHRKRAGSVTESSRRQASDFGGRDPAEVWVWLKI